MAGIGGVREYNRIRRFLGEIYLYGFFSREDFAESGIGSVKDYDYGVKLIRSIFPEIWEDAAWIDGRKYPRMQRQYARSGENRMTDSYLLHTIDVEEELPELLLILSALRRGPQTLDMLCRAVELHSEEEESSKYATVRRRVLDLAEYGYVRRQGKQFSLAEDPLRRLTDQDLERLYDYVRFAGGVTFPRTAGSFLRRTVERELARRSREPGGEAPFLLRQNVNANVLDEEIVYQLLDLIHARREAELSLKKGTLTALPVALRADTRLGRWYLLTLEENAPCLRRVSAVRNVKPGRQVSEEAWQAVAAAVRCAFSHSGCSGAVPEGGPVLVEARLDFQDFPAMGNQFAREIRIGRIAERADGSYYEAVVNDPQELLPLLRSYAPWLSVLPGDHGLDALLRESLLQMRQALEEAES